MNQRTESPPHDYLGEKAILAACFTDSAIIPQVLDALTRDDFYLAAHSIIFQAIEDLGEKADLVTVWDYLHETQKKDIGGKEYLIELADSHTIVAAWKHHAKIVKKHSIKRQIDYLCSDVTRQRDPDQSMLMLKAGLEKIETSKTNELPSNKRLYNQIYNDIYSTKAPAGLTTGIANIDSQFYLEPGCSHVIAAESGIGKSAICLQIADHIARTYGTVLYFSMESTRGKLGVRQIARYSHIALTRLNKRNLHRDDEEYLQEALGKLINSRLVLIDDIKYQTIERAVGLCEALNPELNIKCIVLDYLQLLSSNAKFQNRHLEISEIAKRVNFLAKDLDIPVILVSQLGKDIEKRTKRRPILGDIKESGDVRNHADNIIFLHAPDPSSSEYEVEVFLAKGKDQEQWKTWLHFNGHYQEFTEGTAPLKEEKAEESWRD